MITVVAYKAEHARVLVPRDIEKAFKDMADFDEWAVINEGEIAFTALVGEEVIACGGIREMWEGVGEAWLLFGANVVPHRFSVVKAIKRGLTASFNKFHRVQAHARMDFSMAHMFLHRLGFKAEGYLNQYYPDKMDGILYAIVKEV